MPRWSIIRTLLYKEVLRYRYNWGLLVVVAALLALSALIALGSRYKRLPGQASDEHLNCIVIYKPAAATSGWIEYLKAHPPQFDGKVEYRAVKDITGGFAGGVPQNSMIIQLFAPDDTLDPATRGYKAWKAIYLHEDDEGAGTAPYRDWMSRNTKEFLNMQPSFYEETEKGLFVGTGHVDRVPLLVTALVIFALYLLSFNLFITSTGEEREKRVLLGLLLTPASALEVMLAKAVFYGCSSLVIAMSVAVMYQPRLVLHPLLWTAILSGSFGYVAIGTIIISIVRRQTTINTVSMLYLMLTTIIIFLGQFLPLFGIFQRMLMENYLYAQVQHIIDGKVPFLLLVLNQVYLLAIVIFWSLLAVAVFQRQGTAIARAR